MKREAMLARLQARRQPWDMVVIGGGATGVGIAIDAASRGYEVALVEREDFGSATSSRSTKLIHGGVRYLEQGNFGLVREALEERELLRRNAPHLVHDLAFVVPNYAWWEASFYGTGLKLYDWMAGRNGFGRSHRLGRRAALAAVATLRREGLRGAIAYHDGQFDDARLLIHMAATAAEQGAALVNYAAAVAMLRSSAGRVQGVRVRDGETGSEFEVAGQVVINATGIFADQTRRLADPNAAPMLDPSQGVHLVFDRRFVPGETAMLVPHTRDGRVVFAIPWHQHTLVGTTDTPGAVPSYEPRALESEIAFMLETVARYLDPAPRRADVLSVFAGIRPLVKKGARSLTTARRSREHVIHRDTDGLLTIAGGKWTTCRRMAEECVDAAIAAGALPPAPCRTRELRLHGWSEVAAGEDLEVYGADAAAIQKLAQAEPAWARRLHPALPIVGAQVVWAARREMARTVEDVLARRTRALFLHAGAAVAMAPAVARLLAAELGRGEGWAAAQISAFTELARGYSVQ